MKNTNNTIVLLKIMVICIITIALVIATGELPESSATFITICISIVCLYFINKVMSKAPSNFNSNDMGESLE